MLRAEGEAKALVAVADAQAKALVMIGEAADTPAGQKAVQLDLATKAIHAKEMIAKESSLILLPDSGSDAANLVTQAMAIIQKISNGSNNTPTSTVPAPASQNEGQRDTSGPWGE